MAIKCPECDTSNPSDSRYCKQCATPLPLPEDIKVTETMEAARKELTTGSIFAGRYQIIEELGKGGMGKVYRVLDKELKEEVALKLIRPEIAYDKKTVERFNNELKLARKIIHKNVGRMYELMEDKGTRFITMEYVPGEDLKSFIRRSRQLTVGTVISIAKQVCEGLEEAHGLGVVHRDLKPQNIMIDKDGNARIMDFGIARSLKAEGITDAGVMIGTPEYMSPEQVDGKEVDQRSDLYLLGVILYEMVTGKVPFEGDAPFAIGMKHKSEKPKDPREINAQIPKDLSRVILRCMEKDKEKRYQNAGEVCSELSGIEKGLPSAPGVIPERRGITSKEIKGTFRKHWVTITIPLVVVILVGLAILYITKEKPVPPSEIKKLVVLPFENLGPSEDEYFADGITDAVTARLARLRNLGVISRQSAVQYKNSKKSPQEISEELGGVQYILEGTVQRERPSDPTSRVRIIPQLIDVSDNTHLWAETYDDEFSEVFRVQSDIAEHVANALEIVLLEPERQSLTARPTDNPEAYELYLSAGRYRAHYSNENRIAVELLERAVAVDPEFALAYVWLSRLHSVAFFTFDRSEKHKTKAKEYADKAILLNPELPDAHLALGKYYYECLRDYERALEEFAIARQGLPNDTPLLMAEAFIWRRQGRMAKAAENFEKAFTLDPRSSSAAEHLAITLSGMRSYAEAKMYFDKAIALAPDLPNAYSWQAWNYLAWRGDTQQARAVLERMPEGIDPRGFYILTWSGIHRIERNNEEALSRILDSPLEILSFQNFFFPKAQLLAEVRQALGDNLQARADYKSAQEILEREMVERPDDPRLHISLGLVYAGLGRKQDAIREGRLAVEQVPVSKDHFVGQYFSADLARIYTMVGEHEEAIDQLEYLLSISSGMGISPALLRTDPRWDPLRGNPRFEKFLKE